MKKKEMKASIAELLSSGINKQQVFDRLSGQGVKDSVLANMVASQKDLQLCEQHSRKVSILISLTLVQAVLAALQGFIIGVGIGPTAKWVVAAVLAGIPLLFAWGFSRCAAGAYNAYILLSVVGFSQTLKGFATDPVPTAIGFAINLALLAYVWYVRNKLFPDFNFVAPRKIKGKYVFAG